VQAAALVALSNSKIKDPLVSVLGEPFIHKMLRHLYNSGFFLTFTSVKGVLLKKVIS